MHLGTDPVPTEQHHPQKRCLQEEETTKYAIEIPKVSSLILTHSLDGEVKGLKEAPREDRPPVLWVFWTFRIMVGLGTLMITTGLIAIVLFFMNRLFDTRWFQYWCMALTPAGFAAVLAGWFVTEVGRQPWIVQGLLRTEDATSPVMGTPIAISLAAFIVVYVFVFGAGSYYILKLISKGPEEAETAYGDHGVEKPPIVTEMVGEKGAQDV
jgi:cytochrome d ubiquinol oxidase subunit I